MADNENLEFNFDKTLVQGAVKKVMTAIEAPSRDLWQVAPQDIRVMEGFNVRVKDDAYYAHIRSIADSIKTEGFFPHKPLAGYVAVEDGVQVIYLHDGHCRFDGAKLAISEGADLKRLPLVVSAAGTSLEDLTVGLVRDNSGRPLSTYETAVVCKRLSRFGWDSAQIAKRLGFSSAQYVDGLLTLIAAPLELRQMVINGVVSASVAIDTLAKHGDKALDVLRAAQQKANGAGKTKVTQKFMPDVMFKRQVKKAAEPMWQTLNAIKEDKGFKALSPELREKLTVLLDQVNKTPGSLPGV